MSKLRVLRADNHAVVRSDICNALQDLTELAVVAQEGDDQALVTALDVTRHDRMVSLVTQLLDLHGRLAVAGVPHDPEGSRAPAADRDDGSARQRRTRWSASCRRELTPEEIKVVEGTG